MLKLESSSSLLEGSSTNSQAPACKVHWRGIGNTKAPGLDSHQWKRGLRFVPVSSHKDEAISMMKKMELLEDSKRKLMGEGLDSCSNEDLINIEHQLEYSISKILARMVRPLSLVPNPHTVLLQHMFPYLCKKPHLNLCCPCNNLQTQVYIEQIGKLKEKVKIMVIVVKHIILLHGC
ncbi:hypothetical protein SAY86_029050 [Trapa natans]|uniref:K-box domain-containing protein n=1 Tax=Trapa natans TaxID=22666 RepID=A0AAN7M352_TRANT|nr:hypothetical protein SAY86_029050 [Trapa natans]